MKACIYNPYLDSLGGGERYSLAVAQTLASAGYSVDFQWTGEDLSEKFKQRFGIDVSDYEFIDDAKRGDGYDLCFWVSDGSIPLLRARKNILHFQVPFHDTGGKSLINRAKLFRIHKVVCNSNFTKRFIDEEYGVESVVVYPPVAVEQFRPKRKENLIVYVGRFSGLKQAKRQDFLISAFKKFYRKNRDWRLVLVGGAEIGAEHELVKLRRMARNLPVQIVVGPSIVELRVIVGKARIFWSAAGFGVSENKEPERVEHFGISLVEAMAAKAVPVVYAAGGYREIVRDGENGCMWGAEEELLSMTEDLIAEPVRMKKIGRAAHEDAQGYSAKLFQENFLAAL